MGMYGHCSCPTNEKRASRTCGCEFSRQAPASHQEWIDKAYFHASRCFHASVNMAIFVNTNQGLN